MIELSELKLVQGTSNVNPIIDAVAGMNGTAAVIRLNALVDRLEELVNQLLVDEINFLAEEPTEKEYVIEARSGFQKKLTRLTGFTSAGSCTVNLIVDGLEEETLAVDDEESFVGLDKDCAIGTTLSFQITAVDEAADLALTLQFERLLD